MFRHQGKSRTSKHNLQLATILSLVAGIVNVTGFLEIKQLTTNVTGHFALFINDVADAEFWKGTTYFLYILSFFFGSFMSSFLIESFRTSKKLNIYVIPSLIECLILLLVPLIGVFDQHSANLIACMLLFAMGLQNSYVTSISNSIVRTTHLTGLFTDMGIEISQLFFPGLYPNREKLKANIKLRIYIISSFFGGGLIGGFLYSKTELKLKTLIIASMILLIGLLYDDFRYRIIKSRRKFKQRRGEY